MVHGCPMQSADGHVAALRSQLDRLEEEKADVTLVTQYTGQVCCIPCIEMQGHMHCVRDVGVAAAQEHHMLVAKLLLTSRQLPCGPAKLHSTLCPLLTCQALHEHR